jgi:ABC-type antimicrobial peptide transport system permease subunit
VTRTSQRPEAFAETLRKLVRAAHPALAVDNIRSMDTRIADSLITRRSPALLAGIFAGVALLLAAIGTYGVLSYAVAQRTREIGIRMALGAQAGAVLRMIMREGSVMLVCGIAIGLLLAVATAKIVSGILYEVGALDPIAFTVAPLVLTIAALIATWLPARRATQVDPAQALRAE